MVSKMNRAGTCPLSCAARAVTWTKEPRGQAGRHGACQEEPWAPLGQAWGCGAGLSTGHMGQPSSSAPAPGPTALSPACHAPGALRRPRYPRLLGHLHMLIAMSGYLPVLITGAMFGPSAFAYLGENGWIWLYLCRADVTGCYFQPGCHGNNQASAPVSSSIYNLLILFHLSD